MGSHSLLQGVFPTQGSIPGLLHCRQILKASLVAQVVKNLPAMHKTRVQSLSQEDPTPVLLPGESHGQRGLMGYSPWGRKESDVIEATWHAHKHT